MLILCEKSSVAGEFSAALGGEKKQGYFVAGSTVITYCVGHLFELLSPEGYDPKYRKWAIEDLPIIPKAFQYNAIPSTAQQAKIVIGLLRRHAGDDVLIATDAGREGELIARIALHEAGIVDISRFRRFWVSQALTVDVILQGIKNAKPLSEYDSICAQGFARQRADWLVGMNLSRLMSIGNPPPVFSVGRVQTAVLSCVAARNTEVKNFAPVPYKELAATILSKDGVAIKALLENPKTGKQVFFDSDDDYLRVAVENCKNKSINSVDVQSIQKTKNPEKLLNITGLQKVAFKRFGLKPEETLSIAQSLYETHKCLSYPRTPSRVMGDNNIALFREKFELLKNDSPLSIFSDPSLICQDNRNIFDSSKLEDHHALIPLARLPSNANVNELNVFSIVLKSFFTVCMPPYVYKEKSLRFHVDVYSFTAKIREVLEKGWMSTGQNPDTQEGEDSEQEVSLFNERSCALGDLEINNKISVPKKDFAFDTLLAFMEQPKGQNGEMLTGLGTPATRAEIIKTLFTRGYIKEEKKKLYATERGNYLLKQLYADKNLAKMTDIGQTTEWEKQLYSNPMLFEQDIVKFISMCVKSDIVRPAYQQKPIGSCPLCESNVLETKWGYNCSDYKKCSFGIRKTIAGASVSAGDAAMLLAGQVTKPKNCKTLENKHFDACFALEHGKVTFLYIN